jgi:spore coat protein CotH
MKKALILVSGFSLLTACAEAKGFSSSSGVSSAAGSPSSAVSSSLSSGAASSSASVSSSSPASSSSSLAEGVALPESAEFKAFWDYSSSISVSLKFTNAALHALSYYGANDSQKWGDVYFPCTLSVSENGHLTTYEEAGARMKGNTSRREICDAAGKITQSCHFKISLKATFDDAMYDLAAFTPFKHDWSADSAGLSARKKRNLYGMEKFDLKYLPRNEGETLSQEIYCYDAFRSAGFLAPHAKWAAVNLATEASAKDFVYEIIEDVDKVFLKRHFPKAEAQGDLYKCVWGTDASGNWSGANLARDGAVAKSYDSSGFTNGARLAKGRIGVEDNYNGYHPNYQLKTNDDGEASDFSKMANYINAIWNLRYEKAPQNTLESLLDVQEFLKFEALSYLFGNFDDQRNNANNYYLYFRPSDGKAIYLPYDWDWAVGAKDSSKNLDLSTFTPLQTTGLNGEITTNVYWVTFFANSALAYSQSSYVATYKEAIRSYVNEGYLTTARYSSLVSQAPAALGSVDLSLAETYMAAKLKTISASL